MNNMLPYLVTLGFLAIWALTHLFNREAEPLPPRPGRPPNGNGPRPPQPGGPTRAEPTMRWAQPGAGPTARPAPPRPARLDDDIVILESEPKRPAPPARSTAGAAAKRSSRSKPSAAPPAKRAEAAPAKLLGAPLSASIAPLSNRPVEFKPLTLPQETLTTLEPAKKPAPAAPKPTATTAALNIPALLTSPDRVRESFILSQILQPPRSRIGHRR